MLATKFGFVLCTFGAILIQVCWGLKIDSSRFKQFSHIKTKTPQAVQEQAVKDLITRLIPKQASKFLIRVNSSLGPHSELDTFEYVTDAKEGKLVITGTTGVAAALGFQHFLKYSCHAHVSWSGDQLKIPEPFPVVQKPVMVTSPNRYFYINYGTFWLEGRRWCERENFFNILICNARNTKFNFLPPPPPPPPPLFPTCAGHLLAQNLS